MMRKEAEVENVFGMPRLVEGCGHSQHPPIALLNTVLHVQWHVYEYGNVGGVDAVC